MADDDPLRSSLADVGELQLAQIELEGLVAAHRRLNGELAIGGQLGRQFGRLLSNAFLDVAARGKGLGDVLRSLALGLSRLVLGAAFRPLEGLLGSAFQSLLTAPAPFAASGAVAAPAALAHFASGNSARWPTLAPSPAGGSAGRFQAGAAAPTIVLNISTPDAESFRRSEAQIAAVLARAVGHGQRNL